MNKVLFLTFLLTQSVNAVINGTKLMNLINCYAWYLPDAAHRQDNSKTENCVEESIIYCRTDSGNNDHLCKFDGTNFLVDDYTEQECYFNCQMETCNAWNEAHNQQQQQCITALKNNRLRRQY